MDELRFFWEYFHLIPSLYEDYKYLSEEWSAATQKEEQRLRTSPRDTNFVGFK